MIRFLSIDPSMANTALVFGYIENGILHPEGFYLSQTTKTKNKQIRASSDMIRRCRETVKLINETLEEQQPNIVFCETPSGSQNSKSAQGYGISCVYIALMNPPAIEVTPIELKKATVGKKTASKKEMINWAAKEFPNFPFFRKKDGSIIEGKMEHVADAIGAAYAGLLTDQYKQLVGMLKD